MARQTELDFSIDNELPTLGVFLKNHGVSALHVTLAGDNISVRAIRSGLDGSPGIEGGIDEPPEGGGTPKPPQGTPSNDWENLSSKTGGPCTCELIGLDTEKGRIKVKANNKKHPRIEVYGEPGGKGLCELLHPTALEFAQLKIEDHLFRRFDKNGVEEFKHVYKLGFNELHRAYFQRNARRSPK